MRRIGENRNEESERKKSVNKAALLNLFYRFQQYNA